MFVFSLLAILGFGVFHSILAAFDVKSRIRSIVGDRAFEGFYRLGYNIVSAMLLTPLAIVLLAAPSSIVWQVSMPWSAAMFALQVTGLLGLMFSTLQVDVLRFAGISQALAYFNNEPLPLPPEEMQRGGFYNLVRHPLYLFSLLLIWPVPTMTDTYLGFAIGATLYFIIGSRMEEQKLARIFPEYESYRQRVPWLLPWPRPNSRGLTKSENPLK